MKTWLFYYTYITRIVCLKFLLQKKLKILFNKIIVQLCGLVFGLQQMKKLLLM